MKKWQALLVGAFLMLGMATQAQATIVITEDPGGIVDEYVLRWETVRAAADRVVVAGPCASACTTMLGIVPDANICATKQGVFLFHSAVEMIPGQPKTARFSPAGTAELWQAYPERVRAMLRQRGWHGQEHPGLVAIRGDDIVQACPEGTTVVDYAVLHHRHHHHHHRHHVAARDVVQACAPRHPKHHTAPAQVTPIPAPVVVPEPTPPAPVVVPEPTPEPTPAPVAAPEPAPQPVGVPELPIEPRTVVYESPEFSWLGGFVRIWAIIAFVVAIVFVFAFGKGFLSARRS